MSWGQPPRALCSLLLALEMVRPSPLQTRTRAQIPGPGRGHLLRLPGPPPHCSYRASLASLCPQARPRSRDRPSGGRPGTWSIQVFRGLRGWGTIREGFLEERSAKDGNSTPSRRSLVSSFDMPFSFIMIYFLINHMDTLSSTSCHLAITLLSSRTTCGSSRPVRLRPKPSGLAQVRCLSGFFHTPSICCKLHVQTVSSLQPEPSK